MRKALFACAALLIWHSAAKAAEVPACATLATVQDRDLTLLHKTFANYDQVKVADIDGLAAKNALFIMVKMGAPESALQGARVVIFSGRPPAGNDGEKIGDAHLYVFGADGCMQGGSAIPMALALSFAGLGA
jgi:hypothetical protein